MHRGGRAIAPDFALEQSRVQFARTKLPGPSCGPFGPQSGNCLSLEKDSSHSGGQLGPNWAASTLTHLGQVFAVFGGRGGYQVTGSSVRVFGSASSVRVFAGDPFPGLMSRHDGT